MKSSHTVKYNKHLHIVNDGCHTMFVARQRSIPTLSITTMTSILYCVLPANPSLSIFGSFPPEFSLTNFSKASFYHYRMVVVYNVMGINNV